MKKINIVKALAFVTAMAFTISTTSFYAGEIIEKNKYISASEPTMKESPKVVVVEDGITELEKLNNAFENGNTLKAAELCDIMLADIEADKAEAAAVAKDIDQWADDEIIARQKRYESELNVKSIETSKALYELKAGVNIEENMAFINEEMAEPIEYHKSDATPNIAVQPVELSVPISDVPSSAEIISPASSADDLVYDRDSSDPAAIKDFADKFKNAKDIYLFVKNSVANEAYVGSKKDPSITLEQLGGNDIDQAALLISLLRAKGIPARFISGTVMITPEQAVDITGASDAVSAGRILAARYKNTTRLNYNGEIVGFRMSHTWVEAYIPYTDYRGAGNANGESVWVQLDPSFKKVVPMTEEVVPEFSDADIELLSIVNNASSEYAGYYGEDLTAPETVAMHFRELVKCTDDYIPSSLPYTVVSTDERYSFIKESDRASISISVDGDCLMSASVSELYGKPLIVSYEPASSYDREVMEHYEKITDVPAYLVNVVPVVTYGGETGRGEMEVSLGAVQRMVTCIKDGSGTTMLDDTVYAGSMYAVNIDLQRVGGAEAEAAEKRLQNAEKDFDSSKACTPEVLGAFLDYSGKYYFSLCDSQASVYSSMMNIDNSRQLGLAITGYQFHRMASFGVVKSLTTGSFYIDVAYNSSYILSLDGNKNSEKGYISTIGMIESYYEGYIWEQLLDKSKTCISTVSVMKAAVDKGIGMRYITKSNLEEELAKCNIEEYVRQEVRDFVNRGMAVEIVPETLTIGDWTGTAYIAVDMTTASASYMISGGTAGGSSMDFDDLFQINIWLSTINAELALGSMVMGYTKFETGQFTGNAKGMLEGAHAMIGAAFSLGSAFKMRYAAYDYIFEYAERGDDCLGDFEEATLKNVNDTIVNLISFGGQLIGGNTEKLTGWLSTIYSTITTGIEIFDDSTSTSDKIYDAIAVIWDIIGHKL